VKSNKVRQSLQSYVNEILSVEEPKDLEEEILSNEILNFNFNNDFEDDSLNTQEDIFNESKINLINCSTNNEYQGNPLKKEFLVIIDQKEKEWRKKSNMPYNLQMLVDELFNLGKIESTVTSESNEDLSNSENDLNMLPDLVDFSGIENKKSAPSELTPDQMVSLMSYLMNDKDPVHIQEILEEWKDEVDSGCNKFLKKLNSIPTIDKPILIEIKINNEIWKKSYKNTADAEKELNNIKFNFNINYLKDSGYISY